MNPHEAEGGDGLRDEVDELFDAARAVSGRSRGPQKLDWAAVFSSARRVQRRRLVLSAAASALAASLVVVVALWWSFAGESPAAAPALGASRIADAEYRLLRVGERIQVIAEPTSALRRLPEQALALDEGVAWVRVDGSAGPVPFAVVTPDARVEVLGTRFGVAVARAAGTDVAVLEGRVRVRTATGESILTSGQRWRSTSGRIEPIDAAWRSSLATLLEPDEAPPAPARCPRSAVMEPSTPPSPPSAAAMAPGLPGAEPPAASAGGVALSGTSLPGPASATPGTPGASAVDPHSGPVDTVPPAAPPTGVEALYREAEAAMRAGRLEQAAELLGRVAAVQPGSYWSGVALLDLGRRLEELGRHADATAAYRRYLSENPLGSFRGEARIALCRLELGAGRVADARACYAQYLREQPRGPYAEEASRGVEGPEQP